ncbi:MAG: HupE/UreJ family protein [Thermonemataceae bacterium]|nr:HupE/UreJ family protein [Thermonemataceae bacterium]
MELFKTWLGVGFHHIVGIEAQDHILFLVALTAAYFLKDWKKILCLATAFTIGHSLTLVLVTYQIIRIPSSLVENWLIPLSIAFTALLNVLWYKDNEAKFMWQKYIIASFFGLVHGSAFSNQLSILLKNNASEWFGESSEQSTSIILPLLAFNLGIELGQILIIVVLLVLAFIFVELLKSQAKTWRIFLSGIAFGVALSILLERVFAQ